MVFHEIGIGLHRIDFAVMGQHTKRLCQPPLREGIGGITLMVNRGARDKAIVFQIRVKGVDIFRQEHAFINDGLNGKRADVKARDGSRDHTFFDAAADDVKLTFKLITLAASAIPEHNLLNGGPCGLSFFADNINIDRHLSPTVNVKAFAQKFGLDNGSGFFLCTKIRAWQENHTDGDFRVARLVARALHLCLEKLLSNIEPNTGTVACLAVRINGAPVPDIFKSLNRHFHNVATRCAINRGDETDATGIMLISRIIGTGFDQQIAVFLVCIFPTAHSAASKSSACWARRYLCM